MDAGVVQGFERHSARHGTVADNGYGLAVLLSVDLCGQSHAQSGGNGGGRVAGAERVVFAFRHFWETADAAVHPLVFELLFSACENLVGVTLVSHIPDQIVVRRVEGVMQGDGEFHDAQARAQMSRILGAVVDDFPAYFLTDFGQGVFRDFP